jgi:hypothetical protein
MHADRFLGGLHQGGSRAERRGHRPGPCAGEDSSAANEREDLPAAVDAGPARVAQIVVASGITVLGLYYARRPWQSSLGR